MTDKTQPDGAERDTPDRPGDDRYRHILAEAAHEIRSPLQNIISQLSILRRIVPENEEVEGIVQRVTEEALRAKRQLSNVLSGTVEPRYAFGRFHLGTVITSCARQYEARAADRGIRLVVWDDAKSLPDITADREKIEQILVNLLDNAVKYSFRGEDIDIHGAVERPLVRFWITNFGIGIPSEYHDAIFEPYHRRAAEERRRFIAGTGIGLSIVREIVSKHAGTVDVRSVPTLSDPARKGTDEGHVVTFRVTLPMEATE